jgi:hypothetical protein
MSEHGSDISTRSLTEHEADLIKECDEAIQANQIYAFGGTIPLGKEGLKVYYKTDIGEQ